MMRSLLSVRKFIHGRTRWCNCVWRNPFGPCRRHRIHATTTTCFRCSLYFSTYFQSRCIPTAPYSIPKSTTIISRGPTTHSCDYVFHRFSCLPSSHVRFADGIEAGSVMFQQDGRKLAAASPILHTSHDALCLSMWQTRVGEVSTAARIGDKG